MASDPVVEYWAEIMKHTPVSPDVLVTWKRVMDHSIEAWSRALSEVMATEEFAQLLGASIEQWIAAQAPAPGNRGQLTALAVQVGRLEERLQQIEERLEGNGVSTAAAPEANSASAEASPAAAEPTSASAEPNAASARPPLRRARRRRAA